jgi:hypothetical protein
MTMRQIARARAYARALNRGIRPTEPFRESPHLAALRALAAGLSRAAWESRRPSGPRAAGR